MKTEKERKQCTNCGNIRVVNFAYDGEFICMSCQLDIMDGYLPLDVKPDKYGRTGKQEDNSQGTF